jgi:DNA ligase-1
VTKGQGAVSARMTLTQGNKAAKSFITKASLAWDIPVGDFHIAGSIRRKEPQVGDVDLVVIRRSHNLWDFQSGTMVPKLQIPGAICDRGGPKVRTYFIKSGGKDVKVNVWFSFPSQLGGMMLFATGSGRYNINLRNRAKKMGLKLTRYGIFDGEELLASRTEEEIFEKLDKRYYTPEERTENAMQERTQARRVRKRAEPEPQLFDLDAELFDLDAYLKGSKARWKGEAYVTNEAFYDKQFVFNSPSGDWELAENNLLATAHRDIYKEAGLEGWSEGDTNLQRVVGPSTLYPGDDDFQKELLRELPSIRMAKGSQARNTAVMLATKWKPADDPTGWWASEKYDGLRALWDGKKFVTRYGNTFRAPAWFTADLPGKKLDGELWAGRGNFQQASSVVRSHAAGDRWKGITFMVFDAPSSNPFEARQAELQKMFARNKEHAKLVKQTKVRNNAHLMQMLKAAEKKGGEGVMLRQPGSPWRVGRWPWIAKVKSLATDEARVVGYTKGKGSFTGMVGALIVAMKDGKEFKISSGLDYSDRMKPPPKGAMVEYAYQGKSDRGIPKLARYMRVRRDVPTTRAPKAQKFDLDAALFDLDAFLGIE